MAGLIGGCDELAGLVLERCDEALDGDIRMNCDTCAYRVALPGFTDKVGRPQVPHYHPDEEHTHSADNHAAAPHARQHHAAKVSDEHSHPANSHAAAPDARQHHAAKMSDEHRHEHAASEVQS